MRSILAALAAIILCGSLGAAPLTPEQSKKVEAKLNELMALGTAPEIVAAVKALPPPWAAAMTQDQWKALSVLSAEVRELSKNPGIQVIRALKDPVISEAFISRADGTKVGFLTKPTNWSHKGKAKHDQPMAGKVWIGEVETDESTGLKQVQVSFPVLDGKTCIGSIVVGLQLSKL